MEAGSGGDEELADEDDGGGGDNDRDGDDTACERGGAAAAAAAASVSSCTTLAWFRWRATSSARRPSGASQDGSALAASSTRNTAMFPADAASHSGVVAKPALPKWPACTPVSYTHLTLPTIYSV